MASVEMIKTPVPIDTAIVTIVTSSFDDSLFSSSSSSSSSSTVSSSGLVLGVVDLGGIEAVVNSASPKTSGETDCKELVYSNFALAVRNASETDPCISKVLTVVRYFTSITQIIWSNMFSTSSLRLVFSFGDLKNKFRVSPEMTLSSTCVTTTSSTECKSVVLIVLKYSIICSSVIDSHVAIDSLLRGCKPKKSNLASRIFASCCSIVGINDMLGTEDGRNEIEGGLEADGLRVGMEEGVDDGNCDIVGIEEGDPDGSLVGSDEGCNDGRLVGTADGWREGVFVGRVVGMADGIIEGKLVGTLVGLSVGIDEGTFVGVVLGINVGDVDGVEVGI
mmetsp:Transcript_10821/g.14139  ORF Transcript_10821/g.14139 Transcript_10821/m.14139 type:complete len:334 (-) Transcript_10821:989-1990(-)